MVKSNLDEMQVRKLAGNKPSAPTQKYLDISAIRNDTVILKDGGLRAIVAVSSTNFALKSEQEQNALVAAYQSFLNSLDFPIQILIQSRILDIDGYLEKLRGLASGQTNELLRIQMSEYIEYIGKLIEFANIMSKSFYIVVPHSTAQAKQGFLSKFLSILNPAKNIAVKEDAFLRDRSKLEERVNHIVSEIGSMGLRSVVLKTPELVELMYNSYNFESASPFHSEAFSEIDLSEEKTKGRRTEVEVNAKTSEEQQKLREGSEQ